MNANQTSNLTPEQRAMLPAVQWPLQSVLDELTARVANCTEAIRQDRIALVKEQYPQGNSEQSERIAALFRPVHSADSET